MKGQGLILVIAIVSFESCASLTKTQVAAVNEFAKTSKDFSAYPSRIITGLADIRVKRGIYYSNSLDSPRLHIDDLDSLYSARLSDYAISTKVDITFKVIDKYAQSLLLLSSDKHVSDLEEQAKNFGGNLDDLIGKYNSLSGVKQVPSGIGDAINKLIVFGGKQYIRSKQAKEIRTFVPLADTLISVMTSNLLDFLKSKNIEDLIENEEYNIHSNYLSYLRQRHPTIENERDYLALKSDIDAVKKLRNQTITATEDLRSAHKKLLTEIGEKKTLKTTISELQQLYDDVNEIKVTIKNIKQSKTQ